MNWTNWSSKSREVFTGVRKSGCTPEPEKPLIAGGGARVAGIIRVLPPPAPVLQDPLAQPAPPTHCERVGAIGDSPSSDSPTFSIGDAVYYSLWVATIALGWVLIMGLIKAWHYGII